MRGTFNHRKSEDDRSSSIFKKCFFSQRSLYTIIVQLLQRWLDIYCWNESTVVSILSFPIIIKISVPRVHSEKRMFDTASQKTSFLGRIRTRSYPDTHCCSLLASNRNRGLVRHNLFPLWMLALKSAKWKAALYWSAGTRSLPRDRSRTLVLYRFNSVPVSWILFRFHCPRPSTDVLFPCAPSSLRYPTRPPSS